MSFFKNTIGGVFECVGDVQDNFPFKNEALKNEVSFDRNKVQIAGFILTKERFMLCYWLEVLADSPSFVVYWRELVPNC